MAGNRNAPMTKVIGAAAAAGLLVGQLGCYVYQPMATGVVPLLGQPVAMDITDAGRVALGGSIGPEISQIEGRLVRDEGGEYELAVSMVHLLRGGEQSWSGERVSVRKEHVARSYEKKLSKGRTAIAGVGGVAIVAMFVSKKLIGGGLGDEGTLPSDTADSQRRPVRP
jgi:hypothetical protein